MKERIEFLDWNDAMCYTNRHINFSASYVSELNTGAYPRDAFSTGQLASKAWLLHSLQSVQPHHTSLEIAYLGCWIGTIVEHLHGIFDVTRIYGFDVDAHSIALSEQFNNRFVMDNWRYKGVVADVDTLNLSDLVFETSGELIETTPSWIINTSCEHMSSDWFNTVDANQLIIMQTNNNPDLAGHINVCESLEVMCDRYPMSRRLYCGEMVFPDYVRYMQIGYRAPN